MIARPDPLAPLPASADAAEIARFAALAHQWWDPRGPLAPLHKLNPARVRYVRDRLAAHFGRDVAADGPLAGLTVADVGSGGGLMCEPLARLGAAVTGIDAAPDAVAAARLHAAEQGLDIDYRVGGAETLAAQGRTFDVVLSLEVVEHVADPGAFVAACCALVRPDGLLVAATLNRTLRAFALAIVVAERVLRWVPPGTHDWRRFLRPSELAAMIRARGLECADATGFRYDPLGDRWRLSRDLGINYAICARRPAEQPTA